MLNRDYCYKNVTHFVFYRWVLNACLVSMLYALASCSGAVKPQQIKSIGSSDQVAQASAESSVAIEAGVLEGMEGALSPGASHVGEPSSRIVRIDKLCAQAEAALLNGRLTLPENDNAYDRFSAVLMLDSTNQYAKDGMKRILLAYIVRVHQALANGDLNRAKSMAGQVVMYYPKDTLTLGLVAKIKEVEKQVVPRVAEVSIESDDRVILPIVALGKRAEEIESLLARVAQRVEKSDESVLIYARNDAEGRWIYKSMKKGVVDYRIRGDIRIHAKPAIVFIPPVEDESEEESGEEVNLENDRVDIQ